MSLITIKKAHNTTDLLVLQSMLESEGIECYLKNENSSNILSHIGAIETELQISSENFNKAQDILEKYLENK
jgi:hypothetical protein